MTTTLRLRVASLAAALVATLPVTPAVVAGQAAGSVRSPAARPSATASPAATSPAAAPGAKRRQHTVIVDAGHGGVDRGMTGMTSARRPVYEKDITLSIARLLAARLEAAGVRVVMTRTADTLIGLYDRGPIANAADGDAFISIHVNAANPNWKDPSAARGFETYFLAEARTEDERRVAEMENASVQYDTGPRAPRNGDALGFMLSDMLQNEHLRESSDLASTIQQGLRAVHPGPSRGVKQGNLVVLVKAFMPSVLVEVGFGSNRSEADWIASASGQAQLADSIARSTLDYLARYDRRVTGGSSGR